MPVRGRGAFPDLPASFRDGGSGSGGYATAAGPSSRAGTRPYIAEYRAMKKLPRYQHALDILRRVGGVVQPIMALRGWHLPLLVEIYPDKDNLLGFNVNAGRKIALRLRRPHDKDDFIDEESIIETMLHELAHNLRGPHDEVFYKHLDKLTEEWQQLRTGGWLSGQGFMSAGQALGGCGSAARLPDREQARRSAESRLRSAARGGSANVLGGSNAASESGLLQQLTPREAALIAAERRRTIANACPSNDVASTQEAAQEQEDDEVVHGVAVITIRDDDEDDGSNDIEIIEASPTAGKRRKVNDASQTRSASHNGKDKGSVVVDDDDDDDLVVVDVKKQPPRRSPRRHSPAAARQQQPQPRAIQQMQAAAALRSGLMAGQGEHGSVRGALEPQQQPTPSTAGRHARAWTCQACTLSNRADVLQCAACEAVRPGVPSWTCRACGHVMLGEEQVGFWCCKVCGQVKVA